MGKCVAQPVISDAAGAKPGEAPTGLITVPIRHLSDAGRLLSKVRVNSNGCWIWTGTRGHGGYGQIKMGGRGGRTVAAHRVSYALFKGEPGNLHVMHSCDMRSCVNPDHLSVGTHAENMADMKAKGRRKGVKNGGERKILTKEEISEAVRRVRAGESKTSVGDYFGVTAQCINYHCKKRVAA